MPGDLDLKNEGIGPVRIAGGFFFGEAAGETFAVVVGMNKHNVWSDLVAGGEVTGKLLVLVELCNSYMHGG